MFTLIVPYRLLFGRDKPSELSTKHVDNVHLNLLDGFPVCTCVMNSKHSSIMNYCYCQKSTMQDISDSVNENQSNKEMYSYKVVTFLKC